MTKTIEETIPHRPPFLFVEEVFSIDETGIEAAYTVPPDLFLLEGHYPGFPLMPGVILCECVLQAGALLISGRMTSGGEGLMPVVTRIRDARFKKMVRPGDRLRITASLEEVVGPAYYLKGSVEVAGQKALTMTFTCAMTEKPEIAP